MLRERERERGRASPAREHKTGSVSRQLSSAKVRQISSR